MNAATKPRFSIQSFESGALDVEAFDHDAHIYIAWLYLDEYPVLTATQRYSDALQRLTTRLGIPGKYHETITWFFMLLIDERRRESADDDWFAFRRCNDDLFARGERSILNRYYRRDTLASDIARRTFVLPDRLTSIA
jgi:hypothetical protein